MKFITHLFCTHCGNESVVGMSLLNYPSSNGNTQSRWYYLCAPCWNGGRYNGSYYPSVLANGYSSNTVVISAIVQEDHRNQTCEIVS